MPPQKSWRRTTRTGRASPAAGSLLTCNRRCCPLLSKSRSVRGADYGAELLKKGANYGAVTLSRHCRLLHLIARKTPLSGSGQETQKPREIRGLSRVIATKCRQNTGSRDGARTRTAHYGPQDFKSA
jgi:hypothetical protein